ncbi:hypothetical protein K8R47_01405 [archaeon]|nr:hypothetical protein [archaeon]
MVNINDDEVEMNVSFTVPGNLNGNDLYRLYIKAYQSGSEDDNCVQTDLFIDIKGEGISDCDDLDGDGYYDEVCGGTDCDDTEEFTYPGAQELCDNIDNDCDGEIDNDCSDSCVDGQTRNCNIAELSGQCARGTQECANESWGECTQVNYVSSEICNDHLDNDCDGLTDGSDSDCVESSDDLDGDGLPDSWELNYFNSITTQDGSEDNDNDGYSNREEFLSDTDPTSSRDYPGSSGGFSWLILIIALVVIAGVIILVLLKNKVKGKKKVYEHPRTHVKPSRFTKKGNHQLKDYISNSLSRGYTREQIKKALSAKGWSKKEIDRAFR